MNQRDLIKDNQHYAGRGRGIAISAAFLLLLHLAACARLFPVGKAAPEILETNLEGPEYLVNRQDVLDVSVYPDAELGRELTVNNRGTISFPLLGDVQVEGLSVTALERKLAALLERDYLIYPQVHVRIKKFHTRSVFILGEINRPGPYSLGTEEGDSTLLELIAMAGGFSGIANIKKVKIIRMEGGQKKIYRVNVEDIIHGKKKDVFLQADDIIIVEQSWF